MTTFIVAIAFVVLWSAGFVGAAWGTADSEPAGLLAWRYVITAALLLAVVAVRRVRLTRTELVQQCVIGLCAHVVFLGGLFAATGAGIDAGTTALVCSAQPVLVAAVGAALWGDRLSTRQWAGVFLGLGAVAISVGGVSGFGVAVLLPVVSLLGLSASALLERRWQPRVDVVTSLAVQVTLAAVVFVVAAGLTTGMAVDPTPRLAAALAWLVIPAGLGGYGAYLLALRRFGATGTSALLYLTPPVSAVWAWAMLGGGIGAAQLVAMGLGIVAVLLVALPARATGRAVGASGLPDQDERRGERPGPRAADVGQPEQGRLVEGAELVAHPAPGRRGVAAVGADDRRLAVQP